MVWRNIIRTQKSREWKRKSSISILSISIASKFHNFYFWPFPHVFKPQKVQCQVFCTQNHYLVLEVPRWMMLGNSAPLFPGRRWHIKRTAASGADSGSGLHWIKNSDTASRFRPSWDYPSKSLESDKHTKKP